MLVLFLDEMKGPPVTVRQAALQSITERWQENKKQKVN